MNKTKEEYFEWLHDLVAKGGFTSRTSFRKLLLYLDSVKFTSAIRKDHNRAKDGLELRERFGVKFDKPCSVLEMMIALAIRCEETIMDNPEYGDRTGQWFWRMIISLGLGSMTDDRFDEKRAKEIMHKFLRHEYEPNGRGGLFTVRNCEYDLRKTEIWYQMLWYINSIGN